MQLFYLENLTKDNHLSKEESTHCIIVLRKKINDEIFITDGKGTIYSTHIMNINNNKVQIGQLKELYSNKRNITTHIAISLIKNRSRFEWFLEKVTELGIDEVTPLICSNSERTKLNLQRVQKILISSLKQSLNPKLPKINNITFYKDFISKNSKNTCIAHCHKKSKIDLKEHIKDQKKNNSLTVMIGPEGDFTEEEIILSEKFNIQAVKLSNQRLRTETAGIVACHTMNLLL